METKKNDINKKELRQSITWDCINKSNWRKLNALQGHSFSKRAQSKNKNINKNLTKWNVGKIFENVNQSKEKIKGVKIKGGLQPHAATHTAFIIHAGNKENHLEPEEAKKYFFEVMNWLQKNLRGSMLHFSMHFDETTPHVHIMYENLTETKKGNFCSFRSLMNFHEQPKKADREALEIFVRRLHQDVSKNFGFLEPRYNQEVRTLDQYKRRQEQAHKDTIESLKQEQEQQEQEQKKQEQQLRILRAEKNNLTIERTRIERTKEKELEDIKRLETLKKQLQELREKELEELTKMRETKKQKKELLEQEQEQQLEELKLKQKKELEELTRQQEQEQKKQEQQLKQEQEQALRKHQQKLEEQKAKLKENWEKQKAAYEKNIEKLKDNWRTNKSKIRTKIESKIEAITEELLTTTSIENMIAKEIKTLNSIAEKLKQVSSNEEKKELIEKILKLKQQKLIRQRKGKDQNKKEIVEEIKQEQKQIKKAKRELNR